MRMRNGLGVLTFVVVVLVCRLVWAGEAAGGSDGWIDLFDGRTLNGWRASENKQTFTVRDGTLVADGPRSHLFYSGPVEDHNFVNFEFQADVKTEPGANSGVYFHTRYQETGWPSAGYEVQINNSYEGHGTYRELKRTGSLYGVRNVYKSPVAEGVWFNLHIAVRGKRIVVRIDGRPVVDYTELPQPSRPAEWRGRALSRGTFALQGHDPGSKVFFRNIRARPLPASAGQPDSRSKAELDFQRRITRYHAADFPLIDYHVHLKGGLTLDEALARSRELGITYGIAVNCGVGFPVTGDAGLKRFLDGFDGQPVFRALQGEGREWPTLVSKAMLERFDYAFTDAMTFTDPRGRRVRLWIDREVQIDDKQAFMDMYVEKIVGILRNEPIDIYVNATFLPRVIAGEYDALWTPQRMDRVIQAAVQNDVAIEINARYRIPSPAFIRRAKAAGATFSFGTNNGDRNLGRLEYCLRMADECQLTKNDIFIPKPRRARPANQPRRVRRADH